MSVTTLSAAKAHLNIGLAATTQDAELQTFIERAEAAITSRCGPLVATVVTEWVQGARPMLAVRQTPVLSFDSVTPTGDAPLDLDALHADLSAGVLEQSSGASFSARAYDVVYTAGHGATASDVPADLRLAVLELIRHMWDTQRAGGSRRVGSSQPDSAANTVPGAAYLFPFRVEQLLGPFVQVAI